MEFQQLRYFVAVARHLHFARAAAELGISQPHLSREIQALERNLGAMLLSRENKWRVTLTAAGRAFLPEAQRLLKQASDATELTRAIANGSGGRLIIGCISSMLGNDGFIGSLLCMRRSYPRVTVEVFDSTSFGLPERIRDHSVDLGLLRPDPTFYNDEELCCEVVCNDELVVAMPREHRLANADHISIDQLAAEEFIMVSERLSGVFRKFLFNFCAENGKFTPAVSGEINNTYTALRMVGAGLGISIVSSSYIGTFSERICYRRFTGAVPRLPIVALRTVDWENPAVQKFLVILRENIR
ncbi:MAG: LysR family transcriptional regulator [Victivallaceae bacterium]|nr:LysR family transcriptional regulator [Victivallaceae bacterium]